LRPFGDAAKLSVSSWARENVVRGKSGTRRFTYLQHVPTGVNRDSQVSLEVRVLRH